MTQELYCPTCGGAWPGNLGKVPDELRALPLYAENTTLVRRWPELIQRWRRQCPGINVQSELEKAHFWEIDNPVRRKKNKVTFLTNWMLRAQERVARSPQAWSVASSPAQPPKDPFRTELLRKVQGLVGMRFGEEEIVSAGVRKSGQGVVPWSALPNHRLEYLTVQAELSCGT